MTKPAPTRHDHLQNFVDGLIQKHGLNPEYYLAEYNCLSYEPHDQTSRLINYEFGRQEELALRAACAKCADTEQRVMSEYELGMQCIARNEPIATQVDATSLEASVLSGVAGQIR